MGNNSEWKVPDIGDFSEVDVIEVLVGVGDTVQAEDPLLTLETDKAAMDVPAPAAGTIQAVKVAVGDKVSEGDVIFEVVSESASDAGASGGAPAAASASASGAATPSAAPASAAPPAGADDGAADAGDAGGPATAGGTEEIEVRVPDIGDFDAVDVIEVMISPGDVVEPEAPLVTMETDKAAMDIPAPRGGTIREVLIAVGDKISEGDLVARMTASDAQPAAAAASSPTAPAAEAPRVAPAPAPSPSVQPPAQAPAQLPPIDEARFSRAHASPSVRKFARELGVDLGQIRGSGLKGRVTRDDVKALVKSVMSGARPAAAGPALPEIPKVDFAAFGEIEREPLGRIQKISGPRLHASWVNLPHVTQHDDADSTDLEAARKRLKPVAAEKGVKLTPLAFLVRAVALALDEFPVFKASLDPDGKHLVKKKYTHIGFAADTPNGLMVPVIRDADRKDAFEIAADLAELSEAAREGKLKAAQMQGGCFTISSLGGIGGTYFTPIINAPEVAILGVSRSRMTPVWQNGEFVPRLMLPLSLSYDHRVIDGAAAVRFTTRLGELIAQVDPLLPADGGA